MALFPLLYEYTEKHKQDTFMKITIIGGGFGGVKAALELSKDKKNHITLISDKTDFQYYPVPQPDAAICNHGCHLVKSLPVVTTFL
jgi:2-polyprenyl-6-methoxyphenol hydroxylase-like FAD-dependent oxidoreductase